MNNQLALVTGGTSGIGLAAAMALGSAGATVVVLGATPESGHASAEVLVAMGIDAVGDGAHTEDHQAMEALAQRLGALAEPDIVIASAGVMSDRLSKTVRTSPAEWDRVLGINLTGVWNTLRLFAPPMIARRSGRIVTVSACLGRFTGPGTAGGSGSLSGEQSRRECPHPELRCGNRVGRAWGARRRHVSQPLSDAYGGT